MKFSKLINKGDLNEKIGVHKSDVSIKEAYNELIELVKEETAECWFQEYSGANYKCRFCDEYNEHHKDCFVVQSKKLIGDIEKC